MRERKLRKIKKVTVSITFCINRKKIKWKGNENPKDKKTTNNTKQFPKQTDTSAKKARDEERTTKSVEKIN